MRRTPIRVVVLAGLLAQPTGLFARGAAQTTATDEKKTAVRKTAASIEAKKVDALRSVATEDAPKAIGPYSQGVVGGGFLFASGQIPLDPKSGDMVSGSIEQAADRVFDNLEAVLKAEGLSFADVVKTTVYLTKADDFAALNAVYGRRMGESKPARATVIVAALPRNAPLEIELIARTKR